MTETHDLDKLYRLRLYAILSAFAAPLVTFVGIPLTLAGHTTLANLVIVASLLQVVAGFKLWQKCDRQIREQEGQLAWLAPRW